MGTSKTMKSMKGKEVSNLSHCTIPNRFYNMTKLRGANYAGICSDSHILDTNIDHESF